MVEVEHFGGFWLENGDWEKAIVSNCRFWPKIRFWNEIRSSGYSLMGHLLTFQFAGSVGAEELRACMVT